MWSNWSGSVRFTPRELIRPRENGEIRAVLTDPSRYDKRIRVVGAGHSYTPLVDTTDPEQQNDVQGTLLDLRRCDSMYIDSEGATATIGAGRRLHTLGKALRSAGLALENQGDVDRQALGGALATGTHGTGLTIKALPAMINAFEIITADGKVRWCSSDAPDPLDRDLFRFGRIHLGVLGIVTRIRLRLVPLYLLDEMRNNEAFEEAVGDIAGDGSVLRPGRLEQLRQQNRHVEMWWFPYADKVRVKTLNPPTEPNAKPNVSWLRKWLADIVVENIGFWCLAQMTRIVTSRSPLFGEIGRWAAQLADVSELTDYSYRIFPKPRWVRANEMEYAVPLDRGPACLFALRDLVRDNRMAVFFPIEYRFVAADDIPLSPFNGRDSAVISIHKFAPTDYKPYFNAAEQIFLSNDGRPHWGKHHSLTAERLSTMHADWDAFQALRRRVDPKGVFMSPYMKRLLCPLR